MGTVFKRKKRSSLKDFCSISSLKFLFVAVIILTSVLLSYLLPILFILLFYVLIVAIGKKLLTGDHEFDFKRLNCTLKVQASYF